jgi:hypothetical protein
MTDRGSEAYWRHLREGLPMVVALLLLTGLEFLLDAVLHFGTSPLDRFMPHAPAVLAWELLLYCLGVTALLLYLTGHTTGILEWALVSNLFFTGNLLLNVWDLVLALPERVGSDGWALLLDGLLIWLSNVLLFSVWYWLVDGGGYLRRAENERARRDFLFPLQATPQKDYPNWRPHYFDYLFLALTTSTAFSPTDTQPLSGSAKLLQGSQALISFVVTALIVARAVNILTTG